MDKVDAFRAAPLQVRIQYTGAIAVLAVQSHFIAKFGTPDELDMVESAVADWCEMSGWTYFCSPTKGITLHEPPRG